MNSKREEQQVPGWSEAAPSPPPPTLARCILGAEGDCGRIPLLTAQKIGTAGKGWQLPHVCLDWQLLTRPLPTPPCLSASTGSTPSAFASLFLSLSLFLSPPPPSVPGSTVPL